MLPAGGGVKAHEVTSTGLHFQVRKAGTGASPTDADVTLINYKGTLKDGYLADVVVLDERLELVRTLVGGVEVARPG
jgi:N-acetylglucosamine-6-phosphate deacetylase